MAARATLLAALLLALLPSAAALPGTNAGAAPPAASPQSPLEATLAAIAHASATSATDASAPAPTADGLPSADAPLASQVVNLAGDVVLPRPLPDPTASRPTTIGQAMVGFAAESMPALQPGDSLLGLPVLQVVPQIGLVVVQATDLAPVAAALSGLPGVLYIEDNSLMSAFVTPNDTRYSGQYGPALMGFPAAWGSTPGYGSSSIKVAVIDSGIYRTHEDFTPSSRFLAGYDYANGDATPNDDCGHGTHVIGTVAATTDNAKGVAGMSQATILPLKALGAVGGLFSVECTGSVSNVAAAITAAADQGARVISMSLGSSSSDSATSSAVAYAWGKGVTIVAAAGNDGADNSVNYPAAYSQVIAVSAVTNTKALASYSSYGTKVEVAAPGSNIDSTYNDGTYTTMSGTSMATPHVAGALALALSCAPTTTNTALRNALDTTAEDLGTAGRDNKFGYGLARVDRLVTSLCGGTPPPNRAPTASFTHTEAGLVSSVNGAGSSDPDGDALTYAWTFGDGGSATGATASHTYASAGTYTITLTVDDAHGHTASATASVAVTSDPDPGAPTVGSGVTTSITFTAAGQEKFYKVLVPSGSTQLKVDVTGPSCGLLSCSIDTDLYTRFGARPTDTLYDCRPYASGSTESCTHASPAAGYWYIRVYDYSGSGTVTLKATVT